MPDSKSTEAERPVQRRDRIKGAGGGLLIAASVLFAQSLLSGSPNRAELGTRWATLTLKPAELDARAFAPLKLLAAYRITSSDRRFGGVSGLAVEGGTLVALTDSGVVARFLKPARPGTLEATIFELPDGPGAPHFKRNRDSEAFVANRQGNWWVAFEYRNQLWLYDRSFRRTLGRFRLDGRNWGRNRGVEGVAIAGSRLWLFPEQGRYAVRLGAGRNQRVPILLGGRFPWSGWIAEAAGLPDGRIVVAERQLWPTGFANNLVMLEPAGASLKVGKRYRLPIAAMDNVEAIAVEPTLHGPTRLWLMTDNDRGRTKTLLMLVELPTDGRPRD